MTYLINTATGEVILASSGKVVAPAQSAEDPDFVAYNAWANAGNNPTPIETLPEPVAPAPRVFTKLEFRRRFSLQERVVIDNAPDNVELPAQVRAAVRTILSDMSLAEEIQLDHPDVIFSINFLASVGLLTPERAAAILG